MCWTKPYNQHSDLKKKTTRKFVCFWQEKDNLKTYLKASEITIFYWNLISFLPPAYCEISIILFFSKLHCYKIIKGRLFGRLHYRVHSHQYVLLEATFWRKKVLAKDGVDILVQNCCPPALPEPFFAVGIFSFVWGCFLLGVLRCGLTHSCLLAGVVWLRGSVWVRFEVPVWSCKKIK